VRSARNLYRLQIALAGMGSALVIGGAAVLISGQPFALPSAGEVSEACDNWFTGGGPGALLGLGIAALAAASLVLGARSAHCQARASRRYLRSLRLADEEVSVGAARVRLIRSDEPQALCAGYLRPRIYLSEGALRRLQDEELKAVVGHETHHQRRRDPLRLLLARSLADALFFIPILGQINERYRSLGELAADEAAVRGVRSRGPLASALLKFSEQGSVPAEVAGIDPERVDHLLGNPLVGRWELPPSRLARSALALAALGAVVLLVWHGVLNPNLEIPFLLATACTALMIGGPIALAALAVRASFRGLRARRV
jgi:hypothetical protein